MINRLLVLFFVCITLIAKSDVPPDFTMTSTDGVTYNLYSELAKNKSVVLVFFGVSCGSCHDAVPTLQKIWLDYAMQGEKGWVWAFETRTQSTELINEFMQEYGATYVTFKTYGDDSILTQEYGYNITYTPQYVVVCSDKSYKWSSYENILEILMACQQTDMPEPTDKTLSVGLIGNKIVVTTPSNFVTSTTTMVDMSGRVVSMATKYNDNKLILDKPREKGLYIIHLQDARGIAISEKIVITD